MKFAFIDDERLNHRVATLCRVVEVSKAGFYDWCARVQKPCVDALRLETAARAAHARGQQTYGPKRLRTELQEVGYVMSLGRVKRLRKRLGLGCKQSRKYKATTDSAHRLAISPHLLDRRFATQTGPGQVWVADITYIATGEGWLYLAAIKDLFTCKIVGWVMAEHMRAELVCKALAMAVKTHKPGAGLLLHSDRGSQYASAQYRVLIQQFEMTQSMSRKGNCWDNAPMESWFASLKKEQVHLEHYPTRALATLAIMEYIEVFYNRIRRHSKINNPSPINFEQQWNEEQSNKAA